MRTIFKMNKKGDVAVNMIVLMTLVLVAVTIMSFFIYNGKIQAKITDARFLDNIYTPEENARFYISDAGEKAIVTSYKEMIDSGLFTGQSPTKIEGVVVFDSILPRQVDDDFTLKFNENFKSIIQGYDISYKNEIYESRGSVNGDIFNIIGSITISGSMTIKDNKRIWIWYFIPTPFSEEVIKQMMAISYKPKINIIFNISEIGLHSFQDIFSASKACLSEKDVQGCLSGKLVNFNVQVGEQGNYKKVSLISKKKFVVNNLEEIKLAFLM